MDEEKKKAIQEEVVNANNKSLEERIRTLEKRNIEMKKRNAKMEQTIFFLTNKNRNLKNTHNTLRKKIKNTETKLSRVEDTVNLI
jgi:predicted  nucleic acid-binding Zn-ribbon protein